MNSVQSFISENHHQLGYIMQEASRQWIERDSVGAFTVGDCNYLIQKYGEYYEVLEKMQEYEKALKEVISLSTTNKQLVDAQYIVLLALKVEDI